MTITYTPDTTIESQISQYIKKRLGDKKYTLWFDKVTKLSIKENTLLLTVANEFIADWIRKYYHKIISEIANSLIGSPVEIVYEVDEDILRSQDNKMHKIPKRIANRITQDTKIQEIQMPNNASLYTCKGEVRAYHSTLQKKFRNSLETFVVGPSNRLAYNAIISVFENVRSPFNPLFIYGGCGLGKTHLLQGLCNAFAEKRPEVRWCYLSGEEFTNQFISAVKNNKIEEFRKRYRNVDVLVIDDVHFLANKRATQEEFLHTYNAISAEGKQIVLSSDTHPRNIKQFSSPLIDRCISGMVVEITPPDITMRKEIIRQRSAILGVDLHENIIDFIASSLTKNIRELEGAILKLYAYSALCKDPINIAIVEQIIREYTTGRQPENIPSTICKKVAEYFKVNLKDIHTKKRTKHIATARAVAIYLIRKHTNYSFPEIARLIGNKNHSTAIHAYQKVRKQLEQNSIIGIKDIRLNKPIPEIIKEIEAELHFTR